MTDDKGFFVAGDIGELAAYLLGEGGPKQPTPEDRDTARATFFGTLNNVFEEMQGVIKDYVPRRCEFNSAYDEITDYRIDEIAVLAKDEATADNRAVDLCGLDTVNMFQTSEDHVDTFPFGACYTVSYRFLQNALYSWRLELMALDRGVSPLHAAPQAMLDTRDDKGMVPIHASFKCDSKEEYDGLFAYLRDAPTWEMGQACRSTYGEFSYWKYVGGHEFSEGVDSIWLKPRVNTRDSA